MRLDPAAARSTAATPAELIKMLSALNPTPVYPRRIEPGLGSPKAAPPRAGGADAVSDRIPPPPPPTPPPPPPPPPPTPPPLPPRGYV